MDKQALVCDTTVLLYLDRIGQLNLLQALFEPVCVPEPVRLELAMGRLLRPDTIDPSQLNWITPVSVDQSEVDALPPNRLGRGERAVIAYAQSHASHWVGSDDRQARLLAEHLGLKVVGTIGILIRAKRVGLISAVRPYLDSLQKAGFRLVPELYQEALRLTSEETGLARGTG
jgi:predicted nucleic acid-binding protein